MENWSITHWDKPISAEQAKAILIEYAEQKSPYQQTIMATLEAKAKLIEQAKGGDKQAARVLREHTGLEFTKAA